MGKYKIIYSTVEKKKDAKRIAKILIKERIAACVNIFKINSIYRWKGKSIEGEEYALIIKTKNSLVNKVMKRIKELHPYEIPCIICFNIEKGYDKFLNWIDKELALEKITLNNK
ncbi:MAG: divalent-cation tolerance protein CutA [Candidatus Aenigmatarchaeota archaeon]